MVVNNSDSNRNNPKNSVKTKKITRSEIQTLNSKMYECFRLLKSISGSECLKIKFYWTIHNLTFALIESPFCLQKRLLFIVKILE